MISYLWHAHNEVGDWIGGQLRFKWFPGMGAAMGVCKDGKLVAAVAYTNCNKASVNMHVAALPNAHWLTRKFLWTIFAYPFLQLGVNKVLALVDEGNQHTRDFLLHIGMKLEGSIPEASPSGALLIYTLSRSDCRWLNLKVKDLDYGKA